MIQGGKRPGAGRPKGSRTRRKPASTCAEGRFEDAQSYLEAVVRGDVDPDPLRVASARALLPFQVAKQRGHVPSPGPRAMAARAKKANDDTATAAWNQRAAAVRERIAKERK